MHQSAAWPSKKMQEKRKSAPKTLKTMKKSRVKTRLVDTKTVFIFLACLCKTLDVKKINKNHKLTISAINICLSSFNGWHEAGLLFFFFFFFLWGLTLWIWILAASVLLCLISMPIYACVGGRARSGNGGAGRDRKWKKRSGRESELVGIRDGE